MSIHTMLRVGNLQRSIDFYTKILGMKLLRQKDYPEGFLYNFYFSVAVLTVDNKSVEDSFAATT